MDNTQEVKQSLFKRIGLFCLRNIVNLIFFLSLSYYAIATYVLGVDPIMNKVVMIGILMLWFFWFVARTLFKLLFMLLFVLVIMYGWYLFSTREKRSCEEAGRVWNAEQQVCEDKKSIMEQIQELWHKYFSIKVNKQEEKKN